MKTIHLSKHLSVAKEFHLGPNGHIRTLCNHFVNHKDCRGSLEELLNLNVTGLDNGPLEIHCQACYNTYLGIGFMNRIRIAWARFLRWLDN